VSPRRALGPHGGDLLWCTFLSPCSLIPATACPLHVPMGGSRGPHQCPGCDGSESRLPFPAWALHPCPPCLFLLSTRTRDPQQSQDCHEILCLKHGKHRVFGEVTKAAANRRSPWQALTHTPSHPAWFASPPNSPRPCQGPSAPGRCAEASQEAEQRLGSCTAVNHERDEPLRLQAPCRAALPLPGVGTGAGLMELGVISPGGTGGRVTAVALALGRGSSAQGLAELPSTWED